LTTSDTLRLIIPSSFKRSNNMGAPPTPTTGKFHKHGRCWTMKERALYMLQFLKSYSFGLTSILRFIMIAILVQIVCIVVMVPVISSGLYFYFILGVAPGELPLISQHPPYNSETAGDFVIVVAMARNEYTYLEEWVDHQKRVGVDLVVFYDDTPKQNSYKMNEVYERLKPYIDSGFLEIHDATKWDNKSFILNSEFSIDQEKDYKSYVQPFLYDKQQKMMIETWKRFLHQQNSYHHIWLGQVDIDEMYNPKRIELKSLLKKARTMGGRSVRVVKQEFGPSGHVTKPEGPLRANYLFREEVGEKHTGLALVSAITGMPSGCPHVYLTNSFLLDVIRGTHECNNWHGEDYPNEVRTGVFYAAKEDFVMNHYQTKSYQECLARAAVPHPDGKVVRRHCGSKKYRVCDADILRFVSSSTLTKPLMNRNSSFCSVPTLRNKLEHEAEEAREEFCKKFEDPHVQGCDN